MIIGLLVFLVILTSALTLSLLKSVGHTLLYMVMAMSLFAVVSPFLLRVDFGVLSSTLEDVATLKTITLVVLTESILLLGLGLISIRKHYGITEKSRFWWLFYLPGPSLLLTFIIVAIQILYRFSGMNYFWLMALICVGFGSGLLVLATVIRLVFPHWGQRLELKMLVILLQIFCSAFIPVVLSKVNFIGETSEVSMEGMKLFFISFAGMIGLAFLSKLFIYSYRYKNGIH